MFRIAYTFIKRNIPYDFLETNSNFRSFRGQGNKFAVK